MASSLSGHDLRSWAMRCANEAENLGANNERRGRLLTMQQALLFLADNQDWLAGVPLTSRQNAASVQRDVDEMPGIIWRPQLKGAGQ